MIGWIIFVSILTMLLWWLGGMMMPQHTPIIQELIKGDE